MSKSLKEQTVSALFWSFMDKGGQQIIQFVVIFILARLLTPVESGLIGVLSIFIAVANILQESGFSSAIIRKDAVDESDFSSVFYFNVSISIVIYSVLFVMAPFIAEFYNAPVLTNLSRLLFLTFIFNAFGIVQNVHLVKRMDFKTNARITLFSVFLSGLVAVYMAYKGYGVWSLAMLQVVQAISRTVLLWLSVKWYPKAPFSFHRLRSMTSYSVKLLLNSLFNQIGGNLYGMVIGKKFSLGDTGLYTQAYKLGSISQSTVATSLQSVAFPLLNKFNDDIVRKKRTFRKIVRVVSFICFPIALFTIIAAQPIVLVALTSKWEGVIPILRIISVGCAVIPLFYLLSSLLQSVGKSGLLLSIEFVRNSLSILVIIFTVRYGVNAVVMGFSAVFIVSSVIGYYLAGKCIDYKLKEFFKDIFPYILISMISFVPFFFLSKIVNNMLLLLLLQFMFGTFVYLGLLKFFGSKVLEDFIHIVKKKQLD